jgi:putative membrane protein
MRNRPFVLFAALALLLTIFIGCNKQETTTETSDTSSSTTTSASASDTSGTTTTSDTSGTTGTATNATGGTLSQDDQNFAMKAAQGGLAEVSLGSVAASKATNADVKSFGQRMQTDHGKAGDELKQWASTKGITLPTDTDAEHKATAEKVSKESGKAFDKAYMDAMVKDHDKDVNEFKEAQGKVTDPDLKAWIDKTLPVIQDHQKMAHDLAGKLK